MLQQAASSSSSSSHSLNTSDNEPISRLETVQQFIKDLPGSYKEAKSKQNGFFSKNNPESNQVRTSLITLLTKTNEACKDESQLKILEGALLYAFLQTRKEYTGSVLSAENSRLYNLLATILDIPKERKNHNQRHDKIKLLVPEHLVAFQEALQAEDSELRQALTLSSESQNAQADAVNEFNNFEITLKNIEEIHLKEFPLEEINPIVSNDENEEAEKSEEENEESSSLSSSSSSSSLSSSSSSSSLSSSSSSSSLSGSF